MRFQVPQFVDIEDRIIGPLTLKQFLYYLAAAMMLAPVFLLVDLGLFLVLAVPLVGVAALFAHVKLAGQALTSVLSHAFSFYGGQREYIWRRVAEAKPIHISGEEYDDYIESGSEEAFVSLDNLMQSITTQGNVSDQDADDPLEDNNESVGLPKKTTDQNGAT